MPFASLLGTGPGGHGTSSVNALACVAESHSGNLFSRWKIEVEDFGGGAPVAGGLEVGHDAEAVGADGGGIEGGVVGGRFGFAGASRGGGEPGGVEAAEAEESGAGGVVPGGGELFEEGAQSGQKGDFEPAGLFLADAAEVERPEDAAFGGEGAGGANEAGGEELPDEEGDGAGPDIGVEDGEVVAVGEMGAGPGAGGIILVKGAEGAVDHHVEIVVGQGRGELLVGEEMDDGGGDGFGGDGRERLAQELFEVGAEDFAVFGAGGNRDHEE